MSGNPPPATETYRGAALTMRLPRMAIVQIALPGAVFDGHHLPADRARELIDWFIDTGADPARWPHPWQVIARPAARAAAAEVRPPLEASLIPAAPPKAKPAAGGVKLVRGKGNRLRELTVDDSGRLRF